MFTSPIVYEKIINSDRLKKQIQDSAITISFNHVDTLGTFVEIFFNADISENDKVILDAIILNHDSTPYPSEVSIVKLDTPITTDKKQKVAVYGPEGAGATVVTHNFADKCSWYMGAIQVIAGAMLNVGLVYSDPNSKTHFIDLEHARLYDEDQVMLQSGNLYKVKVYVDTVQIFVGFTIDYVLGTITFSEAPSGAVTASYWYADKSYFKVRPKVGKVLAIIASEVQFSTSSSLTESGPLVFEPWFVGHPLYGTMAIVSQRTAYKSFKDFISACNEGQGLIPAIGDVTEPVHVFPFNYVRPKPIKYTDYIEIRVYCALHKPVGGDYATGTFYLSIDDLPV